MKGEVNVLELAARVYEGLSLQDIEEIEEMARRQAFFAGPSLHQAGLRVQDRYRRMW